MAAECCLRIHIQTEDDMRRYVSLLCMLLVCLYLVEPPMANAGGKSSSAGGYLKKKWKEWTSSSSTSTSSSTPSTESTPTPAASPSSTTSSTTTTTSAPSTSASYIEGPIKVSQAYHETGYNYIAPGDFATSPDTLQAPAASILKIYENGVELNPPHSLHADIRTLGAGRFSHWGGAGGSSVALYFSASDNSNPITNGRMYTYRVYQSATDTVVPTPTISGTGRIFYVSPKGSDANPGTASAPWRTIQATALKLVAGDTAVLLDGTYEEPSITFANYGTAAKPITIKAQNKWGAVLRSIAGDNPAISINKSYITIEDLRISVSPNNPWSGVHNSANAAIRAWSTNTPTATNSSTGLVGATIRGVFVDASAMHSVGIKTNQDFTLVEICEIHSSLEAFNNYGTIFRNNVIYGGDTWGDSVYGKGGVRNLQIYNNVVFMTQSGRGLFIGGNSSGWWYDATTHIEAYNSVAYNNVVVNRSGAAVASLGMVGALNSALFNNVVIGGYLFLAPGSQNEYAPRPVPINVTVHNNIVSCGGNSVTSAWASWMYAGSLNVDYNNFYNCASPWPGTHVTTGNPLFYDPSSDWHLQSGSAALGTGTPTAFVGFYGESLDVSKTKDGVLRSVPWNLGTY